MGIAVYSTPLTKRQQQEYLRLLDSCDLRDEGDADIIALATDDDGSLIGCGALAGNTVKQLAVSEDAEGQGVMASVLSSLISEAYAMGRHRLFLCTKPANSRMFSSMGFYPVIETGDALLMENRRDGFENFIGSIPRYKGINGAVVCNCDPFTLGHRHLIGYAASRCDNLYVFAVSEKGSMFSPDVRLEMIRRGTADIPSCHVLESDLYLVSRATFPAYFIRDEERADLVRSDLDIELFARRIAPALNITIRFAGEEPFSAVTRAYNERMKELLPSYGITFEEIPRLQGISAGKVRDLIAEGEIGKIREMVPESTYEILQRQPGSGPACP